MMRLEFYKSLIERFLNGQVTVQEFEKVYLTSVKQEKGGMDPKLFAILQDLFEDVDAYSPLWSEEEESPIRLTEKSLRMEASIALQQLEAYQQQ